jgi:hypothetical protein
VRKLWANNWKKNVKQHEADLKDLRDLRAAKSKEADAPTMSLRELN